MALGDKSNIENELNVPINKLENFNYLTRDQILGLRTFSVMKTPQLLSEPYQASVPVFSQITDRKPWWGMHGAFVWGEGQRSIEGPSEESRFLMNPFLMVGLNPRSAEIWDKKKINPSDLNQPDFPYCWNPVELVFSPKQKLVKETYDVSFFERVLANWEDQRIDREPIREFGLIAYNARDFGYDYIYVPTNQSVNIVNLKEPKKPVEIQQMIHCGGTCKFRGGCNNMSPARDPIDHFKFSKLPATVKVLLWKKKPKSVDVEPDMTVMITLK